MGELRFKFDSPKAAQAVAYLLKRSGEKKISKGHLVKMLYGADKRQMRKTGVPITGDDPYSMHNGPVLSNVLNLLNGTQKDPVWNEHISIAASDTHLVRLMDEKLGDDLLSESEKEALNKAWEVFGPMTWEEVKKFCHDPKNFPEWEDPGRSRKPISFEKIYEVVGQSPDLAEELKMMQREEKLISSLLVNAKAHTN